jgi:flagellar biogenesis protein FliO
MEEETLRVSSLVSSLVSAVLPSRIAALVPGTRLEGLWKLVLRVSRQTMSRRSPKRLRLCESLALGERRFVAVVEVERERFLLGGTANSLVLLSRLPEAGGRRDGRTDGRREGRNEKEEERGC